MDENIGQKFFRWKINHNLSKFKKRKISLMKKWRIAFFKSEQVVEVDMGGDSNPKKYIYKVKLKI